MGELRNLVGHLSSWQDFCVKVPTKGYSYRVFSLLYRHEAPYPVEVHFEDDVIIANTDNEFVKIIGGCLNKFVLAKGFGRILSYAQDGLEEKDGE